MAEKLLLLFAPLLLAALSPTPPPLTLGLAPQPDPWRAGDTPRLLLVSGSSLPLRISRDGTILSRHLLQKGRQMIPVPDWSPPPPDQGVPTCTVLTLEVLHEGHMWLAPLRLFAQTTSQEPLIHTFRDNTPLHCTLIVRSGPDILGKAQVAFDLPITGQEQGEPRGFESGAWDPAKGRRPQDCQFSILAVPMVLGRYLWGRKREERHRARQSVWDQAEHVRIWQGPCILDDGRTGVGELSLHPFPFLRTDNVPRDVPQSEAVEGRSSKGP